MLGDMLRNSGPEDFQLALNMYGAWQRQAQQAKDMEAMAMHDTMSLGTASAKSWAKEEEEEEGNSSEDAELVQTRAAMYARFRRRQGATCANVPNSLRNGFCTRLQALARS